MSETPDPIPTKPVERITFVCQSGELELQSVLLAATLRQQTSTAQLVAAHPTAYGALNGDTLAALTELRVALAEIRNPLNPDYPIGNKLAAVALLQGCDQGLFLDSDMIALRPLPPIAAGICAVPANAQHYDLPTWQKIYDEFGIPAPADGPATLMTEETTAPYYTTGFIALEGKIARQLSEAWVDCALRLDTPALLPDEARRPYLDQISFPIAAAAIGQSIHTLSENWNFQNWRRAVALQDAAILFHYGEFFRLPFQPFTLQRARAARDFSPAIARVLAKIAALDDRPSA